MHRPARLAVDDFFLLAQVLNAVVIVRNERGETVWTSPYSVKDLMDDATVPPLARAVDCLSSEVASVVEAMVAPTRELQETLEYLQVIRGRCCFTRLVPLTGRDGADCVGIFLMPLLGPVASRWTGVNCVLTPDLGRLGSLSPRELEVVRYLAQGSAVQGSRGGAVPLDQDDRESHRVDPLRAGRSEPRGTGARHCGARPHVGGSEHVAQDHGGQWGRGDERKPEPTQHLAGAGGPLTYAILRDAAVIFEQRGCPLGRTPKSVRSIVKTKTPRPGRGRGAGVAARCFSSRSYHSLA